MNYNYKSDNDEVSIYKGNGNFEKRENVDNIENILLLENAKEIGNIDKAELTKLLNEIDFDLVKSFIGNYFDPTISLTLLIGFEFALDKGLGINDDSSKMTLLVCGIPLIGYMTYKATKSFKSDLNEYNEEKTIIKEKIRNLEIFDLAIDKELELERSISNKIVNSMELKSLDDVRIINPELVDRFYTYHDAFYEEYEREKDVVDSSFNDYERRILKNMIEIEKDLNNQPIKKLVK